MRRRRTRLAIAQPSTPARSSGSDGQTRSRRHHRARGCAEILLTHLRRNMRCNIAEDLADRARWCGSHDRPAVAIRAADARIERDRPQERQLIASGKVASAAGSEDVGALVAVRADEATHVLDDTEDGDVELAEHFDTTTHVGEGNILGCRADHRSRHRHALGQAQLHISRAWGQVDDEIVELTPRDLVEELAQRLGKHGATPDDRLTGVENGAERYDLQTVSLERLHLPVRTG